MQIISEFIWKKNSRSVNEDSLCICHVLSNGHPLVLAAICDGVGGMPDGESASNMVINSLKNCFNSISLYPNRTLKSIYHLMNRCLYSCHEDISSGATTVSLVIIYQNRGFILSSGDSRIYMGTNKLSLSTKDHSDKDGRLTQAIGSGQFNKPFKRFFRIRAGSSILLCSDGFYRRNHLNILKKNYFSDCHTEDDWKNKLEAMYSNAVNHGEKDNCSAIVLSFTA